VNGSDAPGPAGVGSDLRFSVVIPAYNEAGFIGDCLRSLVGQDFGGGYEVIVVDNNSTDDTAAIARSYGVAVVYEEHPGVCRARQRGTQAALGEIVVSSDADTRFDSGWLSRIDEVFTTDASVVAVAGPCRYVNGPWWGRAYARALFQMVSLTSRATGRVWYVTATNIAFRKSAWTGYDQTATQGGDELDLLRQLRAHGKVTFDSANPTFTSARRLDQGLAYNLVVSCLFYYLLAHSLNRLFGRTVIGTAPAFRATMRPIPQIQRVGHLLAGSVSVALFIAAGLLMAEMMEGR
jgi:glycosyltransferase involved in cell wall biosynthesis